MRHSGSARSKSEKVLVKIQKGFMKLTDRQRFDILKLCVELCLEENTIKPLSNGKKTEKSLSIHMVYSIYCINASNSS